MQPSSGKNADIRFGPFELNLRAAELRKEGRKIRLQDQPFQILCMLLDRPGEPVLREEIRQKLWSDGTVVEFDHSINAAVKRLRDALSDSAENPRYVETLARRGYRFIGKVEKSETAVRLESVKSLLPAPPVQSEIPELVSSRPDPVPRSPSRTAPRANVPRWAWAVGSIGLAAALGWCIFYLSSSRAHDSTSALAVNSMLLPSQGAQFDLAGNPLAPPALSPDGTQIVFGMKTEGGKHQL